MGCECDFFHTEGCGVGCELNKVFHTHIPPRIVPYEMSVCLAVHDDGTGDDDDGEYDDDYLR